MASGSHGCIFSPSLACTRTGRAPGKVSKLMPVRKAMEEYVESALPRAALEGMDPALQNLFIVPVDRPCTVARLEPSDLEGASKVCRNFNAMMRADLNANLYDVLALPQVDGGTPINIALLQNFGPVTDALCTLMYGVRELNLRGVIHGDVKSFNMVFQPADGVARLIDWGFTRSLQKEYCNETWKKWATPVFMYNCIPSMWVYTAWTGTPLNPAEYDAFVHKGLQVLMRNNASHMSRTDRMFTALNAARKKYKLPPIAYPVPRSAAGKKLPTLPGLSQETTNILVAHGVACLREWGQSKTRFCQMVDFVLRANLDVYGILTCYGELSIDVSGADVDTISVAVSSYLMAADYAVRPYDLAEIQRVLKQAAATWDAAIAVKTGVSMFAFMRTAFLSRTSPTTAAAQLDVEAAEQLVDPTHSRVFPYTEFNEGTDKIIHPRYSDNEVLDQVRTGGLRLGRWVKPGAPPAPAPSAPGLVTTARVGEDTPYFTPQETWTPVEQSRAKRPKLLSGNVLLAMP